MRIRSYSLIILISLVIVLSGCGGSSSTNNPALLPIVPTSSITPSTPVTPSSELFDSPNILLIISDDQGLDASAQYFLSTDLPNTPNLTTLANQGLIFENAWATPACTTTRATLITGKYGQRTGVTYVPALLTDEHQILQDFIEQQVPTKNYQSAVFGKWHLGGGNAQASHPNDLGVNHYAGNLANVDDYFDWELTVNGNRSNSKQYHTTHITSLALEWINQQTTPWFVWLAYSAPHSPFHLPPSNLHQRTLSGTDADISAKRRDYYLAAIEAMDTEIGRLIDSLDPSVRNNTLIIFMGDNGTPSRVIDTASYVSNHAKGTLYQGGVAVPMFVSGKGVSRVGEREKALVSATDLYATIAHVAGSSITNIYDSYSFAEVFTNAQAATRSYIFTQFESASNTGLTVRNLNYKLIEYFNGERQLFSLTENGNENDNLVNNISFTEQLDNLIQFSNTITTRLNNEKINITNAIFSNQNSDCASYVAPYTALAKDVARDLIFIGDLTVEVSNGKCIFTTNAIPNHDFNDGGNAFPNNVLEQNHVFKISTSPTKAEAVTELSLRLDTAILLNGVKVDLLAAGCFGIGDGKVGCNDMSTPWRFDPMHPANGFRVDSHNAHAQPDGTYHYHGSPYALFADDNTQSSPVIGFAADGYAIYGAYIEDPVLGGGQGIRKANSSYRLKEGDRINDDGSIAPPGGNYDGTFRDDYEYVKGLGDLDQCNGMIINGQYGYYITDNYPYVLACFTGTPDISFTK